MRSWQHAGSDFATSLRLGRRSVFSTSCCVLFLPVIQAASLPFASVLPSLTRARTHTELKTGSCSRPTAHSARCPRPPQTHSGRKRSEGFADDSGGWGAEEKERGMRANRCFNAQRSGMNGIPSLRSDWPAGIPWAAKECGHWLRRNKRVCLSWSWFKLLRNLISE